MTGSHPLYFLFAIAILCCFSATIFAEPAEAEKSAEIPQKFYGAFQLNNSENWDEYLKAKGYENETLRAEVKPPRFTRVLYPLPAKPGVYRMMIGTGLIGSKWVNGAKKHADWEFKLGEEFKAAYWDGREHMVTFTFDSAKNCLREKHVKPEGKEEPEIYEYTVDEQNNLEFTTTYKGVKLVHHYVRTD